MRRDAPPATPGPGPQRNNRAVADARRGLHRFAWQIGGRGTSPPLSLPLRGIAVACSFSIELSGWRFVHEPVDTQSGRARNGGRPRAGARCHREGTLAPSRTCSVCRYCAHAAVEWRRSAAHGQFSLMDPQRHRGRRPLPMFHYHGSARCGRAGKSHTGGAGIRRKHVFSRAPTPSAPQALWGCF